MTRAEAINELLEMKLDAWTDTRQMKALVMAINSLKVDEMYDLAEENADEFISKSVIEDIKAEIKSKKFRGYANDNGGADLPDHQAHFNSGLFLALEIIDKHIGKEKE